jgi:Bacterial SH3 domain
MRMLLKSLLSVAFVGVLAVASSVTASAQVLEDRQFRVEFPAGKSAITLRGEIVGAERAIYRLAARLGQTMDVRLTSTTRLVEFSIFDAKAWPAGRPLASSTLAGALVPELNRYIGKLPATGDYRIVVRHIRDLSLPGQRSGFRLEVSITGGTAQEGGTATQLPGGASLGSAAFVKVVGLAAGDTLNMRAGPGTSFRVIDRLAPGEVVRNEGCAASGGSQWCEVSRPSRPREIGWVSARYLAPSKAPQNGGGATQLPGDALVPGTPYNATGSLDCRIANRARTCAFGVIRRGRGDGLLDVTLPSGTTRRIEFQAGRPISSNAAGGVYGEWTDSGAVTVFIGTTEQYTVENAILFGG